MISVKSLRDKIIVLRVLSRDTIDIVKSKIQVEEGELLVPSAYLPHVD